MTYLFTQILVQLPLLFLSFGVASVLLAKEAQGNLLLLAATALVAAPAIAAASFYLHHRINRRFGVERHERLERSRAVAFGVVLALVALALVSTALLSLGIAHWDASQIWAAPVLAGLGIGFTAAGVEEVIFRGTIQRGLTTRFGAPAASVVASVLFAAMHGANPGATVEAITVLSCFCFVLLGLTFWLTGSLVACMAAHFTWNAVLYGVVGGTVSGHPGAGALVIDADTNALISGGPFGIEASVISVVAVCIAFAVAWKLTRPTTARRDLRRTIRADDPTT